MAGICNLIEYLKLLLHSYKKMTKPCGAKKLQKRPFLIIQTVSFSFMRTLILHHQSQNDLLKRTL